MTAVAVERVNALPEKCPNCEKTRDQFSTQLGARWVHYRLIPNAPAAGCGACGHVIYLTEEVYGAVRASAKATNPKAAEGKFKKPLRPKRRR